MHHYWLSQYIKAIVLHQREFEFEFWPIRKFHLIQPGPVPSTILNYCPIRWLLFHSPSWILVQSQAELPSWIIVQSEDCFPSAILNFWPIRDELLPPRTSPPWHRTLTSTLLLYVCIFLILWIIRLTHWNRWDMTEGPVKYFKIPHMQLSLYRSGYDFVV